jgi:phasin
MTEATTTATKSKTPNHVASPFGWPNFEVPNFGSPTMQVPEAFREIAEKSVAHAKDNCEKAKAVAEEAATHLRNIYTTAAKGAADYNLKVIEIARTNANAAFGYADDLLGVKSLSEFIELSTAHARRRFEAITAQVPDHLICGLRSSCERGELMFALVMMLAPVSRLAGTCSPFEAASATLMPS